MSNLTTDDLPPWRALSLASASDDTV